MTSRLQRIRLLTIWLLLLAVSACAVSALAAGSKKKPLAGKRPVRIHYSGNLEGELEPCG